VSGHRLGDAGQVLDERSEHVVGTGFAQLLLAVVTARDADADRVRRMGRGDVFRSVAEDEDALRIECGAKNLACAIDRLARQLPAVG